MPSYRRTLAITIARSMLLVAAIALGLAAVTSYLHTDHSDIVYRTYRVYWMMELEECFLGGFLLVLGAAVIFESIRDRLRRSPRGASIGRWTIAMTFVIVVTRAVETVVREEAQEFWETGGISAETAFDALNTVDLGIGLFKTFPSALIATWLLFLIFGRVANPRVDPLEWLGRIVGVVIVVSWPVAVIFG